MNNLSMIQEKCFFCEKETHMIGTCPRLRPPIQPDASISRQQPRARRTRHSTRSSKIYTPSLRKTSIGIDGYNENSRGIQTDEGELQANENPLRQDAVDRVHNWKIFSPQNSFI